MSRMSRSWRRLLARSAEDRGFTMVELLMGMLLLGIFGGALMMTFSTGLRGVSKASLRNESISQTTIALARMTKVLQVAEPPRVYSPVLMEIGEYWRTTAQPLASNQPWRVEKPLNSGVEMTFWANLGNSNGPTMVHWYVDANNSLIQETINADSADAGRQYKYEPVVRTVLANDISVPQSPDDTPIFAYFTAEDSTALNFKMDPQEALASSSLSSVVGAQVSITSSKPNAPKDGATAQDFVPFTSMLDDAPTPPNWLTKPSVVGNPPEPCTDCGGMPTRAPSSGGGGSGGGGGGGGSPPRGPVAGLS